MHSRDLRTRNVTSVAEYVNFRGTPRKEIASRVRNVVLARFPQLRENVNTVTEC